MKRIAISAICLSLAVFASCGRKWEPVKTSLGDLVKVEKKSEVITTGKSAEVIRPKSGQTLYVLSFEGKSEIKYETGSDDYYPLVDSSGQQFPLIFFGTPKSDGKLSADDWVLNGEAKGKDGRFVFSGTARLAEPKVTFVYSAPENANGLALKDGDQKHPIE